MYIKIRFRFAPQAQLPKPVGLPWAVGLKGWLMEQLRSEFDASQLEELSSLLRVQGSGRGVSAIILIGERAMSFLPNVLRLLNSLVADGVADGLGSEIGSLGAEYGSQNYQSTLVLAKTLKRREKFPETPLNPDEPLSLEWENAISAWIEGQLTRFAETHLGLPFDFSVSAISVEGAYHNSIPCQAATHVATADILKVKFRLNHKLKGPWFVGHFQSKGFGGLAPIRFGQRMTGAVAREEPVEAISE